MTAPGGDLQSSQLVTFECSDADGQPHQYELTPHGALDGQRVVFQLIGLGAEPVGQLVAGVVQSGDLLETIDGARKAGGLEAVMDLDLQALLGAVDWHELGAAVRQVLATGQAPDLVRELLRHAHRDGQPLRSDVAFDQAYRQNYGELLAAAYHSIRINRFFQLPGIS